MHLRAVGIYRVGLVIAACAATGAIAVGCGSSSSTGSGDTPSGDPIKIGVISTDHYAPQEIDSMDVPETSKRWEEYTNSHGGINGHPVEVVEKDDKGNPANGLRYLNEFEKEGFVAIADNSVNDHVDDPGFPASADAAHIPVIGLQSDFSAVVYETDPNYFATGTTASANIWVFLKSAQLTGKKKFGMVCRGPIAACTGYFQAFKKEAKGLGLELVYEGSIPENAKDRTPQCKAAQSAGAEMLFMASPYNDEFELVGNDCAAIGYSPTFLINATSIGHSETPNKAITAAVNHQVMPYFVENKSTAAFHEAMDSYLPEAVSGFEVITTWVGLQTIAEAAKAGVEEGGTPTTDDIYEGLYSFKDNTIGGLAAPLTYVKGKPTPVPCAFFFSLEKGKYSTPWGTEAMCKDTNKQ